MAVLKEVAIHRAVNFFYFGDHLVPKEIDGSGIWIQASMNTNANSGHFYYYWLEDEWIIIYNNNPNNHSFTIGTTLHELGHMAMHNRNTALGYTSTAGILKESWASFVGWYVGEEYYKSIGWTKPTVYSEWASDITGQDRQTEWTSRDSDYSPLFIDLVDDYNQHDDDPARPNDNIVIPVEDAMRYILRVADDILGLDGCKQYFKDYLPCDDSVLLPYLWSYRNSQ